MTSSTKGCPINVKKAGYGCIKNTFEEFTSFRGIKPTAGYITWYLSEDKLSKTLNFQDSIKGIKQALSYVQPHIGKVEFKQVGNQQDAQIVTGFYQNSDPDLPEQFGSSTLGYAYLGNGGDAFNIIGDIFLNDTDFNWTLGATRTTVDFTRIWTHECCHALGLNHQTIDETGILFPSYNPNVPIKLTQDTINGLNSIYGGLDGPEDKNPPQDNPENTRQCLLRILRELFTTKTRLNKLTEKQLVLIANEIGIQATVKDLKRNTLDKIWDEIKN